MPNDNHNAADGTSSTAETQRYTPAELLTTLLEGRGDIAQIHAATGEGSVVLSIHTGTVTDDHTAVTTVDRSDLIIPEFSDRAWQIHAVETRVGPKPVDGSGAVIFYRDTNEGVTAEEGTKRLRQLLADTA